MERLLCPNKFRNENKKKVFEHNLTFMKNIRPEKYVNKPSSLRNQKLNLSFLSSKKIGYSIMP